MPFEPGLATVSLEAVGVSVGLYIATSLKGSLPPSGVPLF